MELATIHLGQALFLKNNIKIIENNPTRFLKKIQTDSLISVLMPVYNAESYLEECLNSIIQQTYTNWELIAVEDQSTDSSFDILHSFAKKDPRIQVLKNEGRKGIIPALRQALITAGGVFVHRMDADDIMAKRKLELLFNTLISNPSAKISTCLVKYFSEGVLGEGYQKYETWLNQLSLDNRHYDDIYKECVIASPAWLIRKEDLLNCGAFESNQYPEDYDLVFRFYEKRYEIVAVNEKLHYWRDSPLRASRNDTNYSDQGFSALKMKYFLKLDRDRNKTLILWGAGRKGKALAKILKEKNEDFVWISNNEKKIGRDIYGVKISKESYLDKFNLVQILIAVSAEDDIRELVNKMDTMGLAKGSGYFLLF